MGDNDGGSSRAAQSAQSEDPTQRPGFFDRIFGRGNGQDGNGAEQPHADLTEANGHSLRLAGGLGNLGHVTVEDVAIPRAEIVSVPEGTTLEALVEVFRESGLTRLPVFNDTLDTPVGFVHLKDLALKHGFACNDERMDLNSMLRPLLFAPPSMPIGVLLQRMQSERIHLALVIDEYGGVDGLVTIEDLLEQVVGEIADEHDAEEDEFWHVEKPGIYLCQSKAPLDEFEAETGIRLQEAGEDDEIETLGGLVFVLSGRVPARGEIIRHPAGVEFEVLDADPRRIKRLRVVLPPLKGD